MSRKTILLIILLIVVVVAFAVFLGQGSSGDNQVTITRQFDGKIVYTTNMSRDAQLFREDCQDRGGTFNECGSVCAPDAEACTQQCAYTCELNNN